MTGPTKDIQNNGNLVMELKSLFGVLKTRRTMVFAYVFMFAFVLCTVFMAINPSSNSSPWYNRIFSSSSSTSLRSQFSSIFSYFSPNSTEILKENSNFMTPLNTTSQFRNGPTKDTRVSDQLPKKEVSAKNETVKGVTAKTPTPVVDQSPKNKSSNPKKKETLKGVSVMDPSLKKNKTLEGVITPVIDQSPKNKSSNPKKKETLKEVSVMDPSLKKNKTLEGVIEKSKVLNATKSKKENLLDSLKHCDIFDGRWVKDESYPLYHEGSCVHIDQPFNCILNGRPDGDYQKLRWQPKGCSIPRLNGSDMLQRLRGKRLVFVGDSLNRNMWESLVCVLENSVKDKSKVFEASGRSEFRTQGSYSFIFKDYNCSVEFVRSPFLVQEWEIPDTNGTMKETLRLDKIEPSSSKYKDADIIVFNTGHWWTHDKTSKGKDYYQEGSHIYGQLNVVVAFGKALKTWAKWIDTNINPKKTLVFFRGYSASHFSGGRWNSGGQCDSETQPIKNETYLAPYPPKMNILESVMMGMKTPISYLNITRMTDYRKDGHPSVYRKQKLTEEERRSPLRYQDCSHWCLPGVPDIWNELLYAQLLIKQHST